MNIGFSFHNLTEGLESGEVKEEGDERLLRPSMACRRLDTRSRLEEARNPRSGVA